MCVSEICCAIKLQSSVRSTDSQLLSKLLCAEQQVRTHTTRTCTLNLDSQSYPPGRKWLSLSWIPLTPCAAHKSSHTKGFTKWAAPQSFMQPDFLPLSHWILFVHTQTHAHIRDSADTHARRTRREAALFHSCEHLVQLCNGEFELMKHMGDGALTQRMVDSTRVCAQISKHHRRPHLCSGWMWSSTMIQRNVCHALCNSLIFPAWHFNGVMKTWGAAGSRLPRRCATASQLAS